MSIISFYIIALIAFTAYAGLIAQQSGTVIIPIPIPDTYSFKLSTPPQNIVANSNNYETWRENSQIISSITNIQLKGKTSFQFTFTLQKETSTLTYHFEGSNLTNIDRLSIDYLLFRNGASNIMNMTDFQWHLEWQKPDALLMFLNGFSEFQLTGNVSYSYIAPSQMYTIHYMGNHIINGSWGKNFLLYSILLIPYLPIESCNECKPIQKYKTTQKSIIQSPGSNIDYFFGLKGYNGNKFKAEFYYSMDLYSKHIQFQFDKKFSQFQAGRNYAIVAVPYQKSNQYIDQRMHKIRPSEHKFIVIIIFFVIAIIAFWCLGFGLYRKYCHEGAQRIIIKNRQQLYQLNQQVTTNTKACQNLQQIDQAQIQRQQSALNTDKEGQRYEQKCKYSSQKQNDLGNDV